MKKYLELGIHQPSQIHLNHTILDYCSVKMKVLLSLLPGLVFSSAAPRLAPTRSSYFGRVVNGQDDEEA
jgi:hypothetical protein